MLHYFQQTDKWYTASTHYDNQWFHYFNINILKFIYKLLDKVSMTNNFDLIHQLSEQLYLRK